MAQLVTLVTLVALVALGIGASACTPIEAPIELREWRTDGREIVLPRRMTERGDSYRIERDVELPTALRGARLQLVIDDLRAPVELRVDGAPIPSPDPPAPWAYRARGPHAWRFGPVGRDHVHLELEVANSWEAAGWFETAPRLSSAATPDLRHRAVRAILDYGTTFALGSLPTIGLVYLALFLLGGRRARDGWFSLQALSASFYPLFVSGLSQRPFGTFDVALFALTQAVAPYAGARVTWATFRLGRLPRALAIGVLATAVVAVVASASRHVLAVALVAVPSISATLSVHLVVLGQLVRGGRRGSTDDGARRPRNSLLLFSGWVVTSLAVLVETPGWFGIATPLSAIHVGSWSLVVIAGCQAVALIRDHVVSLERAQSLNQELAARVGEIEALNLELRHQVAERSRELAAALAQLAPEVEGALNPADVLDRRYRIVRRLGEGGMGAVYESVRLLDSSPVAVKIMKGAKTPRALARFMREAHIGSRVEHENVVRILDVQLSAQGHAYLVMEFVDGVPLGAHPDRRDPAFAWAALEQIARALVALHAAGVVHRDLKPSNVLVSRSGRVVVSDFGISKLATTPETPPLVAGPDATTVAPDSVAALPSSARAATEPNPATAIATAGLTVAGAAMGTPLYQAPEVTRGASAGPAADVFAFGLIAAELFTGVHPRRDPEGWRAARSDLAPEVDAWIASCLEDRPEARPDPSALARTIAAAR